MFFIDRRYPDIGRKRITDTHACDTTIGFLVLEFVKAFFMVKLMSNIKNETWGNSTNFNTKQLVVFFLWVFPNLSSNSRIFAVDCITYVWLKKLFSLIFLDKCGRDPRREQGQAFLVSWTYTEISALLYKNWPQKCAVTEFFTCNGNQFANGSFASGNNNYEPLG